MKSIVTWIAASSLLAAFAVAQTPRYTVTDLGPVGGPPGQPITTTRNGLIAGDAANAGGAAHAMLWYRGLKFDISSPGLGGPNSVAFGVNDSGQVAGEAEIPAADPNGEDFCGFRALGLPSSGKTCLPFLWQYGVMTPLPTLGGPNGTANQVNSRGEVAGVAKNTTRDPACPAPQVLQSKPVIWEPLFLGSATIQELATVAGDPDGLAMAINDNRQVVGASGDCAAFNQATYVNLQPLHALLWQYGTVTDLGNLGGTGHGRYRWRLPGREV